MKPPIQFTTLAPPTNFLVPALHQTACFVLLSSAPLAESCSALTWRSKIDSASAVAEQGCADRYRLWTLTCLAVQTDLGLSEVLVLGLAESNLLTSWNKSCASGCRAT